ncbi:paraquat-inducible protein A [Aestuariibius insulae]|uniref:paraquat-inducible protein A n=1 Tax=Aestuariibius insulae TaxID=2058287 RepID=UPI00345ED74A
MIDTKDLIACPTCDALWRAAEPKEGERAVCGRCHTVLRTPRKGEATRITALALTVAILLVGTIFLPFLHISVRGFSNDSSIVDAALAFSEGLTTPLVIATVAMVLLIPLGRALLLLYVVAPIAFTGRPQKGAATAYRWSEDLKPWSMAEIFILGCAVALVKVTSLATVVFGSAFWLFSILVIITVFQDGFLSRWSIWQTLDQS